MPELALEACFDKPAPKKGCDYIYARAHGHASLSNDEVVTFDENASRRTAILEVITSESNKRSAWQIHSARLLDLLALRAPRTLDSLAAWWARYRGRAASVRRRPSIARSSAVRSPIASASRSPPATRSAARARADHRRRHHARCASPRRAATRPRTIETTLVAAGDGYELTGHKKWATVAPLARRCSSARPPARSPDGKNQLRWCASRRTRRACASHRSSAPFVPEIPHAEVELDGVRGHRRRHPARRRLRRLRQAVPHRRGCPRPRRAARLPDRRRAPARLARDLIEQLLALAVDDARVALADPKSPATHIALAGLSRSPASTSSRSSARGRSPRTTSGSAGCATARCFASPVPRALHAASAPGKRSSPR